VRVLITGAGALVGRYVAEGLAPEYDILALKHADLDITDRDSVKRVISTANPSLIINCAVIQVDESEQNPAKASAVNVDGPRFLAEAASTAGAEMIHFGSQYAFDGEPIGRAPYTIQDEPRPVNVYGKTKIAGERAVCEACPKSYIIRTSWVYGSGKKSFLCTVHQDLKAGKRVRAIADIWSSTTYALDLANRLKAILAKKRHGVYHVVNDGVCSYYEFALEAGRLLGRGKSDLDPLIEVVKEQEMARLAARPRYTPMRCLLSEEIGLSPMRGWRTALAEYIRESR
jgi:dTDP-4-dehydrorhamnose reductase